MSELLNKTFLKSCREKLLEAKAELLNQVVEKRQELSGNEFRGDEIDLSTNIMVENQLLVAQQRVRTQLFEIESALARIENGTYGFCEETDEPIEQSRLLALPWTRLSIEGAEIREALEKKFSGR